MGTVAADLPAAEAWVDEWVDALAAENDELRALTAENDELSLRCTTSDATADYLNARCASLQGDVARLQRELDAARAEAAVAAARQQEFVAAGRARITLLRDQVPIL